MMYWLSSFRFKEIEENEWKECCNNVKKNWIWIHGERIHNGDWNGNILIIIVNGSSSDSTETDSDVDDVYMSSCSEN